MSKHTTGPLVVKVDNHWPFKIRTFNKAGDCVFSRDMPTYSTRQKTAEQCLNGDYMGDLQKSARVVNARAVADEVLRAAAPELLEALQDAEARPLITENADWWIKVGAAIAKATGGQQ